MDGRIANCGALLLVVGCWCVVVAQVSAHNDDIVKMPQVKTKKKAKIQALSSFGFQCITEECLPRKLREGDWI